MRYNPVVIIFPLGKEEVETGDYHGTMNN